MWVCKRCGEPHQDQFKECWKCVGAQAEESVMAGEPPPRAAPLPTERKLRSLGSIIVRGLVGFLVGMVLSLSSLNFINPVTVLPEVTVVSSTDKFVFSLIAGAFVGLAVGLFFWVLFPYEPTATNQAE
jgi:hypothetical protein